MVDGGAAEQDQSFLGITGLLQRDPFLSKSDRLTIGSIFPRYAAFKESGCRERAWAGSDCREQLLHYSFRPAPFILATLPLP